MHTHASRPEPTEPAGNGSALPHHQDAPSARPLRTHILRPRQLWESACLCHPRASRAHAPGNPPPARPPSKVTVCARIASRVTASNRKYIIMNMRALHGRSHHGVRDSSGCSRRCMPTFPLSAPDRPRTGASIPSAPPYWLAADASGRNGRPHPCGKFPARSTFRRMRCAAPNCGTDVQYPAAL